jgi:large subunit ribosomal protein L25
MKIFELEGSQRAQVGKKATKQIRKDESIPAVIYGGKTDAIHFSVTQAAVRKLIYTPEIFLVDLKIDGKPHKAILKDVQVHPVSDAILHIDFLNVTDDKPIVMEVPVALEGLAAGVKSGGKLSLDMRKLKVKALYKDIPEKIVLNIESLELGKSVQVGDLHFDNMELLNAKNAVVCRVQLTRAARGAAAAAKK